MVEEPGEEPKLYRQDTGELVTNSAFMDPLINGENNEHPEELPINKENSKNASSHSKLYKDIDDLIEVLRNEDRSIQAPLGIKNGKQSGESSTATRRNSIHLSSMRRERDDKKEKRYSYTGNSSYRKPPMTISEIIELKTTNMASSASVDPHQPIDKKKVVF